MDWQDLVQALFGADHSIRAQASLLSGEARLGPQTLSVLGTCDHTAIGMALALAQARGVLDTMARHPGRPILLLVDTQGQQLRRREELLGLHRAMAHLGCCIALARRRGHAVIALVYQQALSGGFISTGLMADACYALPEAEIRVMRLPAMARVTKLPEARLRALSLANPVFAPGVENYLAMGGVRALWRGDLRAALVQALAEHQPQPGLLSSDSRAADGAERGGRRLAAQVVQQVLDAP